MENISNSIIIGFILTTLVTLWFFYKATKSLTALFIVLSYMALSSLLSSMGFYQESNTVLPRFIFLLGPGVLFVILFSFTATGKTFLQAMDSKWLILLHSIRVPVEIVLYFMYLAGLVPNLMTFSGCNFDILSGISAPIVYYFFHVKQTMGKKWLLIWNFVCSGLLLNVLVIAVLSAKTPFQQFALDQPNIGVAFFPFVWLPTIIVPIVLFAHIASIKQLFLEKVGKHD